MMAPKTLTSLLEKSQKIKQKQAASRAKQKEKCKTDSFYPPSTLTPQYVVSIDPGLYGAIAILHQNMSSRTLEVCSVFDTPITQGGLSKKARENPQSKTYDLKAMAQLLRKIANRHELWDTQVFIEQSQVMSKGGRQQGSVSNFTIGYGYGLWMMALVSTGFQWIYSFAPSEWSRRMFKDEPYKSMAGTKERAIAYVKTHFPSVSLLPEDNPRVKKEKDGRADAITMACYGINHYMWEDI